MCAKPISFPARTGCTTPFHRCDEYAVTESSSLDRNTFSKEQANVFTLCVLFFLNARLAQSQIASLAVSVRCLAFHYFAVACAVRIILYAYDLLFSSMIIIAFFHTHLAFRFVLCNLTVDFFCLRSIINHINMKNMIFNWEDKNEETAKEAGTCLARSPSESEARSSYRKSARDIFGIEPGDKLLVLGDEAQGLALMTGNKMTEFIDNVLGEA